MHNQKALIPFMITMLIATILLMLLLIGFETISIVTENDADYVQQASLQLMRSQILARAAYALKYGPLADKLQAMTDLQVELPLFQKEQDVLSTNQEANVQLLVQQAAIDYMALLSAGEILIAHPNNAVDPIQLNIILMHEPGYLAVMRQLINVLPVYARLPGIRLFYIQISIEAVFIVMSIGLLLITRRMYMMINEEELDL